MRPILKSPRVLRTGSPLTLEGIRQVCPAVFAEGPHESRGERYRYVPTIRPLEALLANGWAVYEASQQQALKVPSKNGFTKHMLRIRKLADFTGQPEADGVPEVILINAHDGTSAYHLRAGYFRFVCLNGMISGTTIAGFKVYHSINKQTSQEVLEAGEALVTDSFPKMIDQIERFKRIQLNPERQYTLANKALDLRYPNVAIRPFPAMALLDVRRPEDEGNDLWRVLNRVQEGIMYGGWSVKSALQGRTSAVRPVERVSAVTAINTGLWDMAEAMAAEAE